MARERAHKWIDCRFLRHGENDILPLARLQEFRRHQHIARLRDVIARRPVHAERQSRIEHFLEPAWFDNQKVMRLIRGVRVLEVHGDGGAGSERCPQTIEPQAFEGADFDGIGPGGSGGACDKHAEPACDRNGAR